LGCTGWVQHPSPGPVSTTVGEPKGFTDDPARPLSGALEWANGGPEQGVSLDDLLGTGIDEVSAVQATQGAARWL
jgi:hypothetical protein